MAYADLTPQEKFVFDWQYRIAGGFHTMLAHLFCKADGFNFNNLANAFPVEAEGMRAYMQDAGWWEHVERTGWEGKMNEDELLEKRKAHISERPPEWAHQYAQDMARQCFGLWYTRPENSNQVLPTAQINETIETVFSTPPFAEWNN